MNVYILMLCAPTALCKAHTLATQLPLEALCVFGCYSLATIGYQLMIFGDCDEAHEELQKVAMCRDFHRSTVAGNR